MYSLYGPIRALAFAVMHLAFLPNLFAQIDLKSGHALHAPNLTFDVISVREDKTGSRTFTSDNPLHAGIFRATNISTQNLIQMAYGVADFKIIGGPSWLRSALFDIWAKCDTSTDDKLRKLSDDEAKLEKQHMLQTLLADRFQLRVHQGTKKLPILALIAMRGGPKFRATKPESQSLDQTEESGDPNEPRITSRGGPLGSEIIAHNISVKRLAELLSALTQTTVIDQTGLSGTYDLTLQWHPTELDSGSADNPDSQWPSIYSAIEEQLGLSLKATTGPVTVLIIEHVEIPSEN